ncbi:hypothetical protein TrLO_g3075 [Triparma laevis f. longispina]|uniref:Uncharacterized protein n=1 Tax=Triparma laevis f. longispina TaxID=1714387 RepID=A0A9W7C985_9STRA|nr:hypothetical protein TrLO_g3075 [Triparma laevis f. longispina]
MSKSVVSASNYGHTSPKTGGKRGSEDEGDEEEEGILEIPPIESSTISTVVSTVPATTDQFMFTPEFGRYFVEFVHVQILMTLRSTTKGWKAAAEEVIDEGVRSGELIVHVRNDIKLGKQAFYNCHELTSMTIPNSLQTLEVNVFYNCSKLVLSNIDGRDYYNNVTSEVVAHLRSKQS